MLVLYKICTNIHVNKILDTATKTTASFGRAFMAMWVLSSVALAKFWMAFHYTQTAR